MAVRLKIVDRETPMMLPPDIREWIPKDHIVLFIIEAVAFMGLKGFKVNTSGSGSEQYSPGMMLVLLIYCYATGRFSSRQIEAATYSDVIVRYICGGDLHPDHDTICTFRRNNGEVFTECFVKVLALASELGCLKKVGGISVDGTKIKANASKHSAVSYKKAGQMIHRLKTKKGKERYKLRKQTVEPVFGTIKETLGFRHFQLRGLEKVELEWDIVTLAYNFKRLFNMTGSIHLSKNGVLKAINA